MLNSEIPQFTESLANEVSAAITVQDLLLHNAPPPCQELNCHGHSFPAFHLGGDYFDFLYEQEKGRYWVFVGDIMGKGIHASMIMVMLRTVVRTMTPLSQSPSELLEKVNNALCKDMEKLRSFATLFCGMYDTQSHTFSYASAGHPNAILGKLNGQTEKLPHKGVAIGFLPNRVYKQFEVSMEQGDSIVICTDGILEAMNQDREQYGYEKLMKTIQTQLVQDVEIEQLIESLTQDVSVYRQGEQRDDVTIVIIRRT